MNKSDILINILTRTHNRQKQFNVCRDSIKNQTYTNINHIVGSDVNCDYCDYYSLTPKNITYPVPERGGYPAPWNLHLNELNMLVKDGWIMYLDDDDKFTDNDALKIIINNIADENELILWKVNINGRIVPSNDRLGLVIAGDISGIGFMFHSKHLPVDWGSWSFGDYRVIKSLSEKLKIKVIDKILTETQGRPNFGQQPID